MKKYQNKIISNEFLLAFTLIELIVVITILAILGTIGFLSMQGYSREARNSVRIADLNNTEIGLELFSINTGRYPEPDEITLFTGGTISIKQGILGEGVIRNINLNKIIKDPKTESNYVYSIFGGGKYYQLGAIEEGGMLGYFENVNADSESVIIKGNYNFDPSLPSLIVVPSSVTGSGLFDDNVCFVLDGGENTFDNCIETKNQMNMLNYDSNLTAYWDMETLNGTSLVDLSGNGYHGTGTGDLAGLSSSNSTGGLMGNAIQFNGFGKIVVEGLKLKNTGTISVLAYSEYINDNRSGMMMIHNGNGDGAGKQVELNCGINNTPLDEKLVDGYIGSSVINNISSRVHEKYLVGEGRWFKYTMTYSDDNYIKVFINGNLVGNSEHSGVDLTSLIDTTIIGGIYKNVPIGETYYRYWNGKIDDIKIYDRELSETEIKQQAKIAGF